MDRNIDAGSLVKFLNDNVPDSENVVSLIDYLFRTYCTGAYDNAFFAMNDQITTDLTAAFGEDFGYSLIFACQTPARQIFDYYIEYIYELEVKEDFGTLVVLRTTYDWHQNFFVVSLGVNREGVYCFRVTKMIENEEEIEFDNYDCIVI